MPSPEEKSDNLASGMRYAGGQVCPTCDSVLGVADRYCRWCGEQLRTDSLPESDDSEVNNQ